MKPATVIVLVLAVLALANDGWGHGDYYYWDDGALSSCWAWYTGGNYWAVQFDLYQSEVVTWIGVMTYPDWPDETYQGCNVHVFDDLGGYPGDDLLFAYLPLTGPEEFEWIEITDYIWLENNAFYIAFQQIGNYPSCDSVGVDAVAGTHDWTGYQGSWSPTTLNGDFMIRCCTGDESPEGHGGIEFASWGELKAAYAELESRIQGNRATRSDDPKSDAWGAIGSLY